jgi:hypothetical protein
MNEFKVYHDDQPNEIVDRIAGALSEFDIDIKEIDGGDGFMHYQIIKTNNKNEDDDYETDLIASYGR